MSLLDVYRTVICSLVVFIIMLILTRIMGRKLLSQMTFFDFVTGTTLGTIGGGFIINQSKGYYALISLPILTLAVIFTACITLKSVWIRRLIEGEPLVIIQNGKIFEHNMKRLRYGMNNLLMQLRSKGIFDIDEVEFAILEQSGQLSVLKKSNVLPATPKDLNIPTKYKGLASEIVRNGKIIEKNLRLNNLTHEWLFRELALKGIRDVGAVFSAILSTDGQLFIDVHKDDTHPGK